MHTVPSSRLALTRKSRLNSSTAISMVLVTATILGGATTAFAQADLTIDTSVSTDWDEDGPGPETENWFDGIGLTSFNDGDNVTFDSNGTQITLKEDLIGRTITFNAASGEFEIVEDDGDQEIMVSDSFDLEINVLSGTAALNVDVRSVDGFNNPTDEVVAINRGAGATGELTSFEDFFTDVEVYGGTFTLESDGGSMNGSTKEALRVFGGQVNINDGAVVVGGLRIQDGGTLDNNAGGEIRQIARVRENGTLNANGGVFESNILVDGSGAVANINANTSADVDMEEGTLTVNDTFTLTGDIDLNGGTVINNETIDGEIDMDGGVLTNAAGSNITGRVDLDGGTINADGGTFDDDIDADGGRINVNVTQDLQILNDTNNGSDIRVGAGVELQGDFTNESGSLSVAATGSVAEEIILNGGTVNADGGTFSNGIQLNDGTLSINANMTEDFLNDNSTDIIVTNGATLTGTVMNTGTTATVGASTGGDIAGLVTLDAGSVIADGGTFSGGLDLNAGTVEVTGDLTDALTNDAETVINVQNGGDIQSAVANTSADAVINNFTGGSITGVVTMTDGTLNAEGGTFGPGSVLFQGGDVNINEATTLDVFNQGSRVTVNAQLTDDVVNDSGTFVNNDVVNGTVTVDGGRFEQDAGSVTGLVTLNDGRIVVEDGTFTAGLDADGGSVGITGLLTGDINANGSDVSIATAGEVAGDIITDNATMRLRGTLTGALRVDGGEADITGEITETLTQEGGLTRVFDGAEIDGETSVNGGALVARGGTFNSDVNIDGGGRIYINDSSTQSGDVFAVVRNQGGRVFIRDGGDLNGQLANETGNTSLRGRVTGTMDISGGTVTARDAARVTSDTNVSGSGTLVVARGVFSNRVRATGGGTVETTGTMTGDIENDGGVLDLGATINGSVSNEEGSAVSNATINDTLSITGGDFLQTGGEVTGQTTVDGGDLTASGGSFSGGIDAESGLVSITGNVDTEELTVDGGDLLVSAAGILQGDVDYDGGSMLIAGTVDGDVAISDLGARTVVGSEVTGRVVLSDGRIDADGGTFGDGIRNNGGRVVVGDATTGDIRNNSGTFVLRTVATLDGDLRNNDSALHNGELTGNVTNSGAYRANGVTNGAVTNEDGGEYNVVAAAEITGGLTNESGGQVNLEGTLASDLVNELGGEVNFDSATLDGSLTNLGTVFSDGNSFVTGDSVNDGTITINTGTLTFQGVFQNNSPNTLNVEEGATVTADGFVNGVDGRIVNAGTLLGDIINNGVIESNGGIFSGSLDNSGDIGVEGESDLTFSGGLVNNGLVDLTGDGNTNNVLTVGGTGLSGSGRYILDINLEDEAGGLGQSDYIIAEAGAPVTGNLEFSFNVIAEGGQQFADIPILIVDPDADNSFTFSPTNVTDPGDAVIYSILRDNSTGNLVVTDLLNPGVGALAGSVVLSQSLIGSVINRPSSPFVNGLAYDDENPCGFGGWARAIGGSADANGRIDQVNDAAGNVSFESEISANYYGFQVGGDYACFNGFYKGWDIAGGGIAGINQGSSSQPIFAFDPNSETGSSDALIATTNVDFTQTYAGIYATAVRDRFAAELQYRIETTDFEANNDATGSLALTDTTFGSDSSTFSGSFSYALSVPNTELSFVPVAGFAYTQISPEEISFDDGGTVQIEDFTSEVVFVGGTLSRTKFGEDGTTALNQFVTATYYNEMADDPVSNYVSDDGLNRFEVTTENLGAYTELSAGLNYVKILDVGNPVNGKQLSASARADVRVSDQLESWGLTAQIRLQF
ncbi:hypothetical protein SAMN04488515_2674 [Cognatiyoonia koreensis]|uniref:Autotransporter domain-containing protein n=1 Tax=Cognatiyoonia koreensis TaxID=364200 RepID=A0A1I0RHM8_9RHOB|nr:hypothetical protein [Cognatiyoonia koreensis]SEW40176.1 hypothetical protein SAMN04488515_2674 [Cognatiyoonia koreensis]